MIKAAYTANTAVIILPANSNRCWYICKLQSFKQQHIEANFKINATHGKKVDIKLTNIWAYDWWHDPVAHALTSAVTATEPSYLDLL